MCDYGDENEGLTLYCDDVPPKPSGELSRATQVFVDGVEWLFPGSYQT